ncbi:TFIIH complex serine/threonine-protein kinase subunit kin28 [Mucor velutinosus]|uniref:Coatomer subunit alpha n=1 Tax=Mucor velutinosus TaxID=708070 RepID=A0AAN7DQ02_9FUNG|nr:TFIIH complex serine/threonine-protein kinase subunit kin28 [Mucor velutinosus]
MQMLTKFESKSNRVKGISFHTKRPWILASLHNGCIQLWDYRMGTLIERFEEHQGPVRGVAFHSTQPLFVSGGDDYKIRVWNYKTRKCLFTLNGHLDYVRTVYFHHEHPWIISASDDQTIRIWNWQSRKCIAILTGHNHYVMSAQFHPTQDYIVSASMDQTVRVWDISGLVKKNRAGPGTIPSLNDPFGRSSLQADGFGISEVTVKYILEGHDRGVNWATFHPTLPLIISGSDDRQVKLWRMSGNCRGSTNNVWGAIFHPRQDLIISAGEDKAIRMWDLTKRTAVSSFKRDHDRFWVLTSHPELNLFAAGHDNGLIVFKLERERPAFQISQNQLFHINKKILQVQDVHDASKSQELLNLSKLGSKYVPPRTLSYNPAEKAVLVTTSEDGGLYELYKLPKNASAGALGEPYDESKRGAGYNALFIARNRFAVFDKVHQQIEIRDLSNAVTKSFKVPVAGVTDIFHAGTGSLVLTTANKVILFDIQQRRIFAELPVPTIKYVIWSNDYSMAALLSKHTITLIDKDLKLLCQIHETIRIKSGVWDESGVFLYCTLNHIKYALPQGDHGIIHTLDQPVYMASVKGKSLLVLDLEGKAVKLAIDPTEYKFKLALTHRKYEEVLYIIRHSNLVGQAIIGYLLQKGYPEIALHFVRDDRTRFELALECGNLDAAMETAQKLNTRENWEKLGSEALKHGNFKMVELAYQRTKNYDRLSFLYLASGNETNLRQMMKIAELRADPTSRFQNAMYLGDMTERIQVLQDVGQIPLAYMTARSHGLYELAQSILARAGKTEEDIELPNHHANSATPHLLQSVTPLQDHNWPLLTVSKSFFEGIFAANNNNSQKHTATPMPAFNYDQGIDGIEKAEGDWGDDDLLGIPSNKKHQELLQDDHDTYREDQDDDEGGWDDDDDDDIHAEITAEISNVAAKETAEFVVPAAGFNEAFMWIQASPLATDCISAGSFETAMQILNSQVGVVQFAPLKSYFFTVYQASRALVPAIASNPSLYVYLRRYGASARNSRPAAAYNFQNLLTVQLQLAYKYFTSGRLPASATQFKALLHSVLFTVVDSQSEVDEANQLVQICREYAMGLAIEQQRRSIAANDPNNTKRALELAAYFTHCQMQPPHLQLALRQAARQAFKLKNFSTASHFCTRLLELAPSKKIADEARQILAVCERNLGDEVQLDYDQYNPFVVCGITYTPIFKGSPKIACPFCQASYKLEFKDKICTVCEVSQIGFAGSGLRVMI